MHLKPHDTLLHTQWKALGNTGTSMCVCVDECHFHIANGLTVTIALGLAVLRETEPITGLSYLVIHIMDQCPTHLDWEMVESRSVEAGLGLTRQLMNRYEGSIGLEDSHAPWTKAIVLRFPVVEGASTEWNL